MITRRPGRIMEAQDREASIVEAVRVAWARRDGAEVPGALTSCRNVAAPRDTFNALVPFLGPEEKDLLLFDGPSNCIAVVVPAELVLCARWATCFEDGIKGVQLVVASRVVDTAVKIITPALGNKVDRGPGHSPEFSTIAAAFDLELLDRLGRGVDKNGALRSRVIVIGAIHQPLVSVRRTATNGKVRSAFQSLIVD